MNKIKKYILILIVFNIVIGCKGQDKERPAKQIISTSSINFLDKKYFHGYELDPNHRYPQFSYRDNKIGEFIVMYLAKDNQLRKEWESDHTIHDLYMGIETTKKEDIEINGLITRKLEPNLDKYYIIAEYIQPKYLSKSVF